LNENVPFRLAFSRQGKAETSFALLSWLNENVLISYRFLSQGIKQAFCSPGLTKTFLPIASSRLKT
ncbi:MAG: hypothetical protein J6N92_05505, partial [Alloprevotella sp.]|nr:hypothetical protein [Alloprevotella sp.]